VESSEREIADLVVNLGAPLSFGMKSKRKTFATQLADDDGDDDDVEAKKAKSERTTRRPDGAAALNE
jgi:hypothetical protein